MAYLRPPLYTPRDRQSLRLNQMDPPFRKGGAPEKPQFAPGEKVPGTCMENSTMTPWMGLN